MSLRAEDISNQMENKDNLVNLDEIFAPDRANRSETPKYILNQEMDRQIEREKRVTTHKGLGMTEIQKQFRERLAASKKRGEERCRMRIKRQEENAKSSKPNLYKREIAQDQQPTYDQQKLIAQGNLKKRLGYTSQVKITPKKTEPKQGTVWEYK